MMLAYLDNDDDDDDDDGKHENEDRVHKTKRRRGGECLVVRNNDSHDKGFFKQNCCGFIF